MLPFRKNKLIPTFRSALRRLVPALGAPTLPSSSQRAPPAPYLHHGAVHASGSALWGHMLPHGSAGHLHRPQDQRVGDKDEEAGEKVAEDEEGEDIERGLLAGGFPGDAAGGAIGLRAVAAPLGQGGHGKEQGIRPDTQQQHAGMGGGELVTCGGVHMRGAPEGQGGEGEHTRGFHPQPPAPLGSGIGQRTKGAGEP